jgi:hypothetical protein
MGICSELVSGDNRHSGVKQAIRKTRRARVVREDIRERLLDAALVEFGARGFDGASTRAIALRRTSDTLARARRPKSTVTRSSTVLG